ncbi:hypothetical protein [Actinoplanes sp. NPDC051859]|uniref:hypothetical protein n=1 Tax=Actinoplanes sp. NPDC051859 TaxID=3363909 RepID=UPI0037B7FE9B
MHHAAPPTDRAPRTPDDSTEPTTPAPIVYRSTRGHVEAVGTTWPQIEAYLIYKGAAVTSQRYIDQVRDWFERTPDGHYYAEWNTSAWTGWIETWRKEWARPIRTLHPRRSVQAGG